MKWFHAVMSCSELCKKHSWGGLTRYSNFTSRYLRMVSLVSGMALWRYVFRSWSIWEKIQRKTKDIQFKSLDVRGGIEELFSTSECFLKNKIQNRNFLKTWTLWKLFGKDFQVYFYPQKASSLELSS